MKESSFKPIKTISIIDGYTVLAFFKNGVAKVYDFEPLVNTFPPLKPLADDYELFKQIHLSPGGYGIIWNEEIDLAAEDVWYDGTIVNTLFSGMLSFSEAAEIWRVDPSTIRKALQYKRLIPGKDVMFFGKQWVVTREAMERVFGSTDVKTTEKDTLLTEAAQIIDEHKHDYDRMAE